MKKIIIVICLFFVPLCTINAQGNQELIHNFTKNSWQGDGVLMGVPTQFKMDWKLVLDNQFIELKFSSIRNDKNGNEIVFEALGLYKLAEVKSLTGTWFDSRGVTLPLKGEISNNQLVINWGNEESEQGRTIYTLIDANSINVKDYILQNNDYQKFGEANYISIN